MEYQLTTSEFLDAFREKYGKGIEMIKTRRYEYVINYEIEISDGRGWVYVRGSRRDACCLKISPNRLADAMETIADYTNNELNCGCTFTMGW